MIICTSECSVGQNQILLRIDYLVFKFFTESNNHLKTLNTCARMWWQYSFAKIKIFCANCKQWPKFNSLNFMSVCSIISQQFFYIVFISQKKSFVVALITWSNRFYCFYFCHLGIWVVTICIQELVATHQKLTSWLRPTLWEALV